MTVFPNKLFTLLEKTDPNIIDWIREGKAFKVLDIRRFEEEILPKYFRHNKVSSLQRQLCFYGFQRVNKGIDMGAYHHPYFQQGRRDLIHKIKRPSIVDEVLDHTDSDSSVTAAEVLTMSPVNNSNSGYQCPQVCSRGSFNIDTAPITQLEVGEHQLRKCLSTVQNDLSSLFSQHYGEERVDFDDIFPNINNENVTGTTNDNNTLMYVFSHDDELMQLAIELSVITPNRTSNLSL